MDTTHDKISRDKAAFAVRDQAISEIKLRYPGSKLFFNFSQVNLRLQRSKLFQVVIIIYFLMLLVTFAEKLLPT